MGVKGRQHALGAGATPHRRAQGPQGCMHATPCHTKHVLACADVDPGRAAAAGGSCLYAMNTACGGVGWMLWPGRNIVWYAGYTQRGRG